MAVKSGKWKFAAKDESVSFGVLGYSIWDLCVRGRFGSVSGSSGMEVMLVISLKMLHYSKVSIYFPSWEALEQNSVSRRSSTHMKNSLLNFQPDGFYLVGNRRMVL